MKRKITPHKAGRYSRLFVRINPGLKEKLGRISENLNITKSDLIELLIIDLPDDYQPTHFLKSNLISVWNDDKLNIARRDSNGPVWPDDSDIVIFLHEENGRLVKFIPSTPPPDPAESSEASHKS